MTTREFKLTNLVITNCLGNYEFNIYLGCKMPEYIATEYGRYLLQERGETDFKNFLMSLCIIGRKITAIKIARACLSVDLSEAKNYVEGI